MPVLPPGFGVLVTRPVEQAEVLCRLIEDAGGKAIRLPLLEIESAQVEDSGPRRLRQLDHTDWLIFVSANAVRCAFALLGPQWPNNVPMPKIAAIGQATAKALLEKGVTVDLKPKEKFNSESLLAQPEWMDAKGLSFLIVRGEGGRELLAETLRQRGGTVEYAEVYRRVAPKIDVNGLLASWRRGDIAVVTLTSGEALANLWQRMPDSERELLLHTPMVVIGRRMARQVRELGAIHVFEAEATDADIFDAVAHTGKKLTKHTNHGDRPLADEDKELTSEAGEDSVKTERPEYSNDIGAGKPTKKRSTGAWLGYGALALVLILVAAGVFLLHELRSKQEGLGSGLDKGDKQIQELLHQISNLQAEVATDHQQLATVQSQVTTEESKFEREIGDEGSAFKNQLEAVRNDLSGSIQHIQQHMNQSRGDIMVADAEYLLSVANQKLHLVGDVKAVVAMMEAADQRLHDSGDPAVFKVREALAEEIDLLKDFNPPDLVGVSAKLLVLEGQVKDLPLFLPHSDRSKEDHSPVASSIPDAEKKNGNWKDSVVGDLKGLVTVRHTDRPVQAILLPEEVVALRQVMLLKLEMARSALLRGDDELYKANMDSALSWLKENFDSAAAATQSLSEDILNLQGLQLHVPLPDVSKSLGLLRNIDKLRLDSEKGHPGKQEKADKPEKAAPSPTAVVPIPAPQPPAPPAQHDQQPPANQRPSESMGPVMEPQPEEGAKP